jgi:GntR family transcriptional regulator
LIRSGTLKEGDSLPSESDLCSYYGISRSTVRQAFSSLVKEGLIIRRRGIGSFVATSNVQRNVNHLYNFTEDMISLGINPSSRVLENSIVNSPEDIASILKLPEDNKKIFKLIRIRLVDDEPLLLETTFIPYYLCPGIEIIDFSTISLYKILKERYLLEPYNAIEKFESIVLERSEAHLLNCKPGIPGFSIERKTYSETGIPFEFTNSVTRGDKSYFIVELYAKNNQANFIRHLEI